MRPHNLEIPSFAEPYHDNVDDDWEEGYYVLKQLEDKDGDAEESA